MADIKIELNQAGVRELLKSDEIKLFCKEEAACIKSRCGTGYEQDTYVGKNRVNAMVYAKTASAQRDNFQNNTILKALR